MEKTQEARQAAAKMHNLTLENRQRAMLTGISEVMAFDENQVILTTEDGEVTLSGEGLHVTRLMLEEGQLTVEGRIDSVFYSQRTRGRGLFHRTGK